MYYNDISENSIFSNKNLYVWISHKFSINIHYYIRKSTKMYTEKESMPKRLQMTTCTAVVQEFYEQPRCMNNANNKLRYRAHSGAILWALKSTNLMQTWRRSTPAGWSCTLVCRAAGTTKTTATGPGDDGGDSRTSCPRGGGECGAGAVALGRGCCSGDSGDGGGTGGAAIAAAAVAAAVGDGDGGVGDDSDGGDSSRCQRPRCRHRCSPLQRPPAAAAAASAVVASVRPDSRHRSTGRRMRPATPSPRSRSFFHVG